MFNSSLQDIVLAAILSFTSFTATAQKVQEPKTDSNWVRPYQPFRIAGNLHHAHDRYRATICSYQHLS